MATNKLWVSQDRNVKMVAHWEMALRSNFFKIAAKSRFCNDFFLFVEFFLEKKTSKFCFLGRFVRECLESEFVRD